MMDYIADLPQVIRALHGVESKHVTSFPVKEVFQGKTVWEGVVEVFTLYGHPQLIRFTHGRMTQGITSRFCIWDRSRQQQMQ